MSQSSETDAMIAAVEERKTEPIKTKQNLNIKDKWLWLDKSMLYFPMWLSLKPVSATSVPRNKYMTWFIVILSVLLCILYLIEAILNFNNAQITHYFLNDLFLQLSQISFKLFSLHYFYSYSFPLQADHQWSHINYLDNANTNADTKYTLMSKIVLLLMLIIYVPYVVAKAYYGDIDTSIVHDHALLSVLTDVLFGYFWWFPITFTFIVHTALCCKYKYLLSQLVHAIKQNDVTLVHILLDYELLYHAFKSDYSGSLQSAIQSFLLGTILYFWGFVYNLQIRQDLAITTQYAVIAGLYGVFSSVLMIFVYTAAGSLLNAECRKLRAELWHIHDDDWKFATHFISFTQKYYVGIKIGKFVVTYKSVLGFFVVFAITKYMTFTVKLQASCQ
eukprot:629712_1